MEEVNRILHDLKSDDWTVRQDAVSRIGQIRDPEVLDRLLTRLRTEKWYVREAVASGMCVAV